MTETMKTKINKRIEKYADQGYLGRLTESWDCDNYQSRDDGSLTAILTRRCKTDSGLFIHREKILIPRDGRKNIEYIKTLN